MFVLRNDMAKVYIKTIYKELTRPEADTVSDISSISESQATQIQFDPLIEDLFFRK